MAEGKMPDVREWAKRFVTSGYSLGVDEVVELLLAFRREDLLAAAQKFGHRPSSNPRAHECAVLCPVCVLERLAEEAGREK